MNFSRLLQSASKIFWAFFLIALPVTSFPFLPAELGGKTQVRPLSIYPMIILLILITLPRLFKKSLPVTFLPLFAFGVAALISSVLSLYLDIEAFKGVTSAARILRNLVTLGIGMAVYLTTTLYHQDWDDFRFTLRWLFVGFGIVLLWGSFQAVYIVDYNDAYFNLLNKIQSLISTQDLYQSRISGLTYEPKWLGEQITFLLMPWLIASVISDRSVFGWRYRRITVELIMLVWAAVVLVFTFSRTGLFILVLLTFFSVLISLSFRKPHKSAAPLTRRQRWLRLTEAILATVVIAGALALAGSRNPYFSRLWRYWSDEKAKNKTYLEYIAFGQRFAYAETALQIFADHPAFGVGLGNYAFYFEKKLPNRPWQNSPEIIRTITPTDRGSQLITPKNLYARLLAETGVVGTFTFSGFVLAILGCSLYLFFAPLRDYKYWGIAGLLGLVVFVTVVFSTDSFAIPNMWVVFGLITAAAHQAPARQKEAATGGAAITAPEQPAAAGG